MSQVRLLATICMTSTEAKEQNCDEALARVREAAARGAHWVLLPEVFAYHGPYEGSYAAAEPEHGPLSQKLAGLARELKIHLFAGSYGERPLVKPGELEPTGRLGHKQVYNTFYVYGPQGQVLAKYRKTHLFNLYSPEGQAVYCESDGFLSGDQRVVVEIEGFRVALAVCYDLRFPEFFSAMARDASLDLIVLPSAFTLQTGMDHWELLLRARAVEQQCYVFAANQTGEHGRGRQSYGHSMIVDPWGYVLANTGACPGIAYAEISKERIEAVRRRLPALANRRCELYE